MVDSLCSCTSRHLEAAASVVPSTNYLTCESGWDDQDQFSFGDHAEHGEILAKPLVHSMKHLVSGNVSRSNA